MDRITKRIISSVNFSIAINLYKEKERNDRKVMKKLAKTTSDDEIYNPKKLYGQSIAINEKLFILKKMSHKTGKEIFVAATSNPALAEEWENPSSKSCEKRDTGVYFVEKIEIVPCLNFQQIEKLRREK